MQTNCKKIEQLYKSNYIKRIPTHQIQFGEVMGHSKSIIKSAVK